MMRINCRGVGVALLFALAPATAGAQLFGEHAMLAFGLKSGSQVPPGGFFVPTFFDWNVEDIVNENGDKTPVNDLSVRSLALFTWVVTPRKLLGGTYGFQVIVPLITKQFEFPRVGLTTGPSLGLGDIYVMPVNLGWRTKRADFMSGLAFYAPTGSYTALSPNNRGLGMWSFELSAGSTLYFGEEKRWHIAALGFYETHTNKEDIDLRVGDIVTVEGGLGGTFFKGALIAGLVAGGQWKVTNDSGDDFPSGLLPGKNHIYTYGPEVTFTGFYKPPWVGSLTARYLWDTGAQSTFEGRRLIVFLSLGRLLLPPAPARPVPAPAPAP